MRRQKRTVMATYNNNNNNNNNHPTVVIFLLLLLVDKGICDYWTGLQDVAPNSHSVRDHDGNDWDHTQDRSEREIRHHVTSPSSFSCRQRPPGYYADMDLSCEVYHLCNRNGGGITFECPEGTRFQQRTMVCDHSYSVNCSDAYKFFDGNLRIGHRNVNLLDDIVEEPDVFMQVVVKESSPGTSNSANLSQNRKRKNKKMMQLVIEDDSKRHSHSDVRISDEKRHGGLTNHDQSHTNVQLEPGRHTNVQLEPGRHTNVQTSVSDADFQKSDALRRTDDHLFNELDDVTFHRESRKSGREEFPYFLNFPPVTSSEKKATSYTRISFSKPANFNFDHPVWSTTTTTTTTTLSTTATTTTAPSVEASQIDQGTTYYPQTQGIQQTNDYILREVEFSESTRSPVTSTTEDILPSDHPLRSVLPESARVVGIQSESALFNPHIMTLAQFLEASRNMDKIHAIRVPLEDKKHVRMIELLANRQTNTSPTRIQKSLPESSNATGNDIPEDKISSMLEELKEIISLRAEKNIAEIHFNRNSKKLHDNKDETTKKPRRKKKKKLNLTPRGGAPSARFVQTQPTVTTLETSPKLEFGFKPLTTQPVPSPTTISPVYFDLHDADQLSAPRPPDSSHSEGERDAFFFTTTTVTSLTNVADSPTSPATAETTKSSLFDFDMRKFFFIPNRNEVPPTNSERRVLSGFFNG